MQIESGVCVVFSNFMIIYQAYNTTRALYSIYLNLANKDSSTKYLYRLSVNKFCEITWG